MIDRNRWFQVSIFRSYGVWKFTFDRSTRDSNFAASFNLQHYAERIF